MPSRRTKMILSGVGVLLMTTMVRGCQTRRVTPQDKAKPSSATAVEKIIPEDWADKLLTPDSPEFTEDLIAKGKVLYSKDCATCHYGLDGTPPLNYLDSEPRPADFFKEGFRYGSEPIQIFSVAFFGLKGSMPPWGDVYTPEELWSIAAAIDQHLSKGSKVERPIQIPELAY